jgi:methylmalonyl-CoA mutase C-terminal domain/subunit
MELLRQNDMTGVKVIVGGIIPGDDARDLERQGVAKVFQPGASLESIVASVREAAGPTGLPHHPAAGHS